MISILTDTLLYSIAAFFVLGIFTYFFFAAVRMFFDVCLLSPKIFHILRTTKTKPRDLYKQENQANVSTDIACAVTVTLTGILYCLFTYIFLDGVLRLLPLLAFLLAIYLLNISLGKRFLVLNKYIKLFSLMLIWYPYYFGILLGKVFFSTFTKIYKISINKLNETPKGT